VEGREAVLERFDGVIFGYVVLVELLDNDQDEEVEHHMADYEDEGYEVDGGHSDAASLVLDTIGLRVHAVIHQPVPVLARRYGEQEEVGTAEVLEIFVLRVYNLSGAQLIKEEDA